MRRGGSGDPLGSDLEDGGWRENRLGLPGGERLPGSRFERWSRRDVGMCEPAAIPPLSYSSCGSTRLAAAEPRY